MNGIRIRAMTAADAAEVARLEERMFADPWPEESFLRELEGGKLGWCRVATDASGSELVGYLVGWFVADEVHLANVAVVPRGRRQGLAQRFLDELVAEGRKRRARLVALEVRASNQAARAFYAKNGFYTVDIRKGYYRDNREDALVMVMPLDETGRIPPREGMDD